MIPALSVQALLLVDDLEGTVPRLAETWVSFSDGHSSITHGKRI